jgi:tetratricopeptide (TPR) repeat protein
VGTDLGINALVSAGTLAFFQGDDTDADRMYREAWRLQGDESTERSATILIGIGNVAFDLADWTAARAFYEHALEIALECGSVDRQAAALGNLGECAIWERDLPAARSLLTQSIALYEQSGDRKNSAQAQQNLAHVAMEEGRVDEAIAILRAVLALFAQFKDPLFTAITIEAFGEVAATQLQSERALRLGGAATALKEKIGSGDVFAPEKARSEGLWARMRDLVPTAVAVAAWESGKQMSLEDAISYALSDS